jgi:O-acetyl-ADP-ribose deacetylase (regulator of RNase III)
MQFLTGDLIASSETAIGHGCNLRGVWGAGIARQMRSTYPSAFESHRLHVAQGDLGGFDVYMGSGRTVVNLYTQPRPGRCASLAAIFASVSTALPCLAALGHDTLALPRIGAGLGGLHWIDVEDVLLDAEAACPSVGLVIYTHNPNLEVH